MTTAIKAHNPVMDDYEWRAAAKCLGEDLNLFDLRGDVPNKAMKARALCQGCPVVKQCAAEALKAPSVGMVRAGLWIPEIAGSHTGYTPSWQTVLEQIAEVEHA